MLQNKKGKRNRRKRGTKGKQVAMQATKEKPKNNEKMPLSENKKEKKDR